jgi:hypothetical protein
MALKEEDNFNLDDVLEIFGDMGKGAPAPAVPSAAAAIESTLSDEENRILAEYEAKKKKRKEEEAAAHKHKEEAEQRILEEYERKKRETRDREEQDRKAAAQKQQADLELLKQQQLQEERLKQEERRIIEEYERERQARAEREKAEQEASEARAQSQLKELAEKQHKDAQARAEVDKAEVKQAEEAIGRQGGDKQKRLLELLGKVQKDLQAPAAPIMTALPVLPPLPEEAAAAPSPESPAEPVPAAAAEPMPDDIESVMNDALCFMFEEARKVFFSYLAPVIGIRPANAMLIKTLEKARAKAPVMLKDANWRSDGTLREDGSLDPERLLKNASGIPLAERPKTYLKAMQEVVGLRLQAVELGLGAKPKAELVERIHGLNKRAFLDKGIRPDWVQLFYQEIIPQ